MFLKEEEIRRIVRKRILSEAPAPPAMLPAPPSGQINGITVIQNVTGGPYVASNTRANSTLAPIGVQNIGLERKILDSFSSSAYNLYYNEIKEYMKVLGLSMNDVKKYKAQGSENSLHSFAKRIMDSTITRSAEFGGGTDEAEIENIMREIGELVNVGAFSLLDMAALSKHFKNNKNVLAGETSYVRGLFGMGTSDTGDLKKLLKREMSNVYINKYIVQPFSDVTGAQDGGDIVAYVIKRGTTLDDGTEIKKDEKVTCKDVVKGLYVGKYTPGYSLLTSSSSSSTSGSGGSGGSGGGTPEVATHVNKVEASDVAGSTIVKKIEVLLNKYAKEYPDDIPGRIARPDETYDTQTETLFHNVCNIGLQKHKYFKDRTANNPLGTEFVRILNLIDQTTSSSTIKMKDISLLSTRLPMYTNNRLGEFAFLLDLINDNIDYGNQDRDIPNKIWDMAGQPGANSGGGTGSGGTGGTGGTGGPPPGSVSGGINTLSAQPQANEDKIDISLEFTGTAQSLEALGFPAGAAASGDQTTVGLKRIFANRMPKNRTTTGGKLIMRVVVNKRGAITNVRVAPEDTNKHYSKRFKNVIKQYLNTIPVSNVIYDNLPGSGRTKTFNLVIDIESGIYT